MGERDRRAAGRVAARFGPFECDACASEIIKALGRGSDARVMRIRPADGSRFIGSVETNTLVSNNRSHVGVQVRDRVFDNLHPEGVPAGEWPGRFLARTGAKLIIEVKPAADFFGARFLQRRFRDWLYE